MEELERVLGKMFDGQVRCNLMYDTNGIVNKIMVTITYGVMPTTAFCSVILSDDYGDLRITFSEAYPGIFVDVLEKMTRINAVLVKRRKEIFVVISQHIGKKMQ